MDTTMLSIILISFMLITCISYFLGLAVGQREGARNNKNNNEPKIAEPKIVSDRNVEGKDKGVKCNVCGAVAKNNICEYCGNVFYNLKEQKKTEFTVGTWVVEMNGRYYVEPIKEIDIKNNVININGEYRHYDRYISVVKPVKRLS